MVRIFLGLGANVGNRRENLRMALRLLAARCTVVAVSSLYRSAAVVAEGQPPGPDYLNAACEIATDLPPADLLRFVKEIEHAVGRRPAARWSPRPIDIDILLYGDTCLDTPELTLPHPLLAERNFVVVPLAELAPEALHPALGCTVGRLAEEIDVAGLAHVEEPDWAAV
ncbi:MAG TPA: 2-amino-4-hydroxy-6-hydroxymethyldihydropteridine diphosphokinase [Dehalococcoidia bacterium]|nr:2-amino-4-hydroxy-6-hydroxymethyldihydropteridine diphosphokinase [Dehalococcoidia bacterium]